MEGLMIAEKQNTDQQTEKKEGMRFNDNKMRFDLIPLEWEVELARVLTIGAAKYTEDNWLKGMPWKKIYSSMVRHANKFRSGMSLDQETRCHHLAMVAWNALALMSYEMRGVGEDFRKNEPLLYDEDFNFIGTSAAADAYEEEGGLGMSKEELAELSAKFQELRSRSKSTTPPKP
jgi:hypothetical protein